MNVQRILVLGGAGFVGQHLIPLLCARGDQVVLAGRDYLRARPQLLLPTLEFVRADLRDDAALQGLVERSDAVINLVGVLHSRSGNPWGPQFDAAHVDLPRRLARAMRRAGVRRLIHLSALGADPGRVKSAPSMYLRSKSAGEQALLDAQDLDLTLFRPSVIFGPGDRFLTLFARMQKWLPLILLAQPDAQLQPIHVEDVTLAIAHALRRRETIGKTYELVGPEIYTLRELVDLAGRISGHRRPIIGLPRSLGRLMAALLEWAPGEPLMTRDNFDSLSASGIGTDPAAMPAPELGLRSRSRIASAATWLGPIEDPYSAIRARQ